MQASVHPATHAKEDLLEVAVREERRGRRIGRYIQCSTFCSDYLENSLLAVFNLHIDSTNNC